MTTFFWMVFQVNIICGGCLNGMCQGVWSISWLLLCNQLISFIETLDAFTSLACSVFGLTSLAMSNLSDASLSLQGQKVGSAGTHMIHMPIGNLIKWPYDTLKRGIIFFFFKVCCVSPNCHQSLWALVLAFCWQEPIAPLESAYLQPEAVG